MREIKFRAWTGDDMVDVSAIIFDEGTKVSPYEPHILDSHNDVHLLKDIELMQYTGLRDKNGVEIYEGDVCSYGDITSDSFMLDNKKEVGQVAFIKDKCALMLQGIEGNHKLSFFWDWLEDLEVIGNIHENPELLESPDA